MAIVATMLRIDDSNVGEGGLLHMKVVVCFSGLPELPTPDTRMIEFDIDPTASPAQLQTAFATGIRARAAELTYNIASNNVNVFNYAKG